MRYSSVLSLVALFMTAACTQEDTTGIGENDKQYITFMPMEIGSKTMDFATVTKAAQTTTSAITSYGVSSSVYNVTSTFSSAECGSYFYNEEITAASGACKYYWPGANYKISFFAYAPYGNSAFTLSSTRTKIGRPAYSYTVPQNVKSQLDIITTEMLDMPGNTTSPVKLTFHHRLTDIRFQAFNQEDTDPLTIKTISMYGMKYSGTLENETWTLNGTANTAETGKFTYSTDKTVTAGNTIDVTGTDGHFMVLPQKTTPTFVVTTEEKGVERTYTATLKSSFDFQMGKSYTFKLTLGDGTLIVDTDTNIKDWEVEVKYLGVSSVDTDNTWSQPGVDNGKIGVNDWVEN